MTTAALFCQSNAYDTKVLKMGRQMAGIGFIQAMIRHGESPTIHCCARTESDFETTKAHVVEQGGEADSCVWVRTVDQPRLTEIGTLYYPSPHFTWLAWQRRFFGSRAYSLCGVTHSLSTESVLDSLGDYLTAPVEAWDALICTTKTGKLAVQRLLADWGEYLGQRFRCPPPATPVQMPVIPLGVDADAFAPRPDDPAMRHELRQRFGIGDDNVAFLFVGRLSFYEKAHPMPMYLGLEAAAKRTGRTVHLIQAGRFPSDGVRGQFEDGASRFCPSIRSHFVSGDDPIVRRDLWRSADVFVSLSDNIQETFGLTPVEAMAAGLPVVVSDWDGYRDTVRNGVDGITVPTLSAPAGAGEEIAFRFCSRIANYDSFVGDTSQCAAVDVAAAADAFTALIENPDLRRRMGDSGRARVLDTFDWRIVMAAYHDLWRELGERRAKAPERTPKRRDRNSYPLRPDPFRMFGSFPTRMLSGDDIVAAAPGDLAARFNEVSAVRMNRFASHLLLPADQIVVLLSRLSSDGPQAVTALLARRPLQGQKRMARTLCWLAKMGLVAIRRH